MKNNNTTRSLLASALPFLFGGTQNSLGGRGKSGSHTKKGPGRYHLQGPYQEGYYSKNKRKVAR